MNDRIEIEGAEFAAECLVQILRMVTRPIPNRWYRFERVESEGFPASIIVHVKTEEQA